MLNIIKKNNSLKVDFSTNMTKLPLIIDEVKSFLKDFNISDTAGLLLVTRELLLNAIEHGNKNDPDCKVGFNIKHENCNRFKIIVEDEGSGFDYQGLDMKLPEDPRHIQKRGYVLINALSNRIEFNSKGNHITVYMHDNPGGLL